MKSQQKKRPFMKTSLSIHSLVITLFVIIAAVVLPSCGTTDPPSTQNTMMALINNIAWNAVEVSATQEGGLLTINGKNAVGDQLQFALYANSPGTYPLGEGLHSASFADEFAEWSAFGVGSGTITILTLDTERVAGYFGFRGKDTAEGSPPKTIANGTFDVDF